MTEASNPGGGESRPHEPDDAASVVLHGEDASVDKRWQGVGYLRVRREVERERFRDSYPRHRESIAHQRVAVQDGDSGKIETLPDGSISIPLYEEELVVTRRTVLRERVIIRKELATEWQTVEAELRRERVRIDADAAPEDAVAGLDVVADRRRPWTTGSETRASLLTSEFALLVLGVAALVVTAAMSDSIDASRFWYLVTTLVAAYALSRGLAKARSRGSA